MAKKGSFSKVYDKNGDYADVEAVRFDGTRTVQMQGDVTASQAWNGDPASPLTLNASIGAKKVTQDKIADKAVGTGQMADGSVGLPQMSASAMTDTVSANNSKLVTSQGVNAAIAAATLNRGKDYGPMSVDEINAISETIPTGSTVYVEHLGAGDAKVINDGYSDGTMASFSVEVGEDLKYYRSPDNSLHGWYSTEANVKIKQPANYAGGIAVDSAQDASSGSAGIEFIQSFKQDTNGNIRDIVKAQVDIVDSTSSTRTDAAATPNSVKSAYDLANGKYSKPSGGIPASDMDSTVQASLGKADTAIQGVKLNGSTLTPSSAKVVDLGNLKTKQTAVADPSASGTTITAIATISQNANGVITATKKTIQSASQSQDGVMSAADKTKLDGIATGAEVNQNAFSNVKVGDVTVVADAKTDTLTLAAGSNVTITPDATNDKITIAAKDTTYTADAGIWLDGTVFKHTNSVSGGTVGPTTDTAGAALSVPYMTYDSQGHVTASGTRTHNVGTASTSGAGIVQLQDSIDATTTKAATPNAVKKAIEALDVSSVGGSGKYISAISETDGKISATATTMDSTPTASSENAVTSGGIKTALDAKADANEVVAICDSTLTVYTVGTNKWFKIAERTFAGTANGFLTWWDVNVNDASIIQTGTLCCSVSYGTSGKELRSYSSFFCDKWTKASFKFVTRGLSGPSITIELWASLNHDYTGLSIRERSNGNIQPSIRKGYWKYYSYLNTDGSAAPTEDAETHTKVNDVEIIIRQHAIASPTNDNLVAMDANGLVKNSGVAVLPSTSTWDGTSDAKVPTAKAVQAKLDAISTAAGAEAEVTAAALDDLDARMQSVEDAVNSDNIGDKIADSLDAQVLKVGGQDVVANIKYVAAQSGGGGDLMKTVAGTQTSVLRFMNDSEAVSIWNDAKQAAANAS